MKSSAALPSFSSSRYPLKVLKLSAEEEEQYRSTSEDSILKVASLPAVLPMVNPYPQPLPELNNEFDADWFGNYE